jgi:tetratricopeptide (TPR) repeat protein
LPPAIEAYEKAIEIKPDFNEAYYSIGVAYANLSKFEKAIEAYEKAIKIKPDFNEAYYSIGVAYASSKSGLISMAFS